MKLTNPIFLSNLTNYSLFEIDNLILSLFNDRKNAQKEITLLSSLEPTFTLINEDKEISALELENTLGLLEEIANKKTILLIDFFVKEEAFTIEETADYLNVSEPYIIKLIEKGILQFQRIENDIMIKMQDIFEYENGIIEKQNRLLKELAKQAQELNLGYNE